MIPKWKLTRNRLNSRFRKGKGIARCKECNRDYDEGIYSICPFCRIKKGGRSG